MSNGAARAILFIMMSSCRQSVVVSSTSYIVYRPVPTSSGKTPISVLLLAGTGRSSREIPLAEVGGEDVVLVYVDVAEKDAGVRRGDDDGLVEHGRGLAFAPTTPSSATPSGARRCSSFR